MGTYSPDAKGKMKRSYPHVEYHQSANGQWRWRIWSRNKQVVSNSAESYMRLADAKRGLDAVGKCLGTNYALTDAMQYETPHKSFIKIPKIVKEAKATSRKRFGGTVSGRTSAAKPNKSNAPKQQTKIDPPSPLEPQNAGTPPTA